VIGPIPLDDVVRITLFATSSGGSLSDIECYGSALANGQHTVSGWISVTYEADGNFSGNHAQLAAGDPIYPFIEWQHANGSGYQSLAVSGSWTYDPIGGLGELVSVWFRNLTAGTLGGSVAAVLDAVRKIHTTPGQV
jgi:hypothetical protein